VRRRFKIAFVILLIVTIAWTLAWHQHVIAYKQMIKAMEELYWKQRAEHPWVTELGLPPSFVSWGYGPHLVISGFILCIAWEFLLEGAYKDWLKDKSVKDEKVGSVAKTLKTLASLLIILLFPLIDLYASLIALE